MVVFFQLFGMQSFLSNSEGPLCSKFKDILELENAFEKLEGMQKEKFGCCPVSGQRKLPLLVWDPATDAGKGKKGSKWQVKIGPFYCNSFIEEVD